MERPVGPRFRRLIAASAACAAGVLLASSPVLAAEPKADAKAQIPLVQIEDKRFEAMVARDVDALGTMIASEAIYIHANGIMQTRAEYLKDVAEGRSRYRAIEAAERDVSLSGKLAITHALVRLHVGTDRIIVARTTGVYRQVGGKWLVVVWQSTPITAVAPAPTGPAAPAK